MPHRLLHIVRSLSARLMGSLSPSDTIVRRENLRLLEDKYCKKPYVISFPLKGEVVKHIQADWRLLKTSLAFISHNGTVMV